MGRWEKLCRSVKQHGAWRAARPPGATPGEAAGTQPGYIFSLHFILQEAFRQGLPEAGQACSPCRAMRAWTIPLRPPFLEHLLFSALLNSGTLPAQAQRSQPHSFIWSSYSVTCSRPWPLAGVRGVTGCLLSGQWPQPLGSESLLWFHGAWR